MLERISSLHPVRELRPVVAVDLFIALSTKCIFRWVFSARFLEVLCGQLEGWNSGTRDAFLFQDVICTPFLYMSKSLSPYVTEVNNGAFCCRILVKWTRFFGVREGLQKERLNRVTFLHVNLVFECLLPVSFFAGTEYGLTKSWLRGLSLCNYSTTQTYSWYLDCLTFEDGANVSSWYVSNKTPINASHHPRRAKTSTLNRCAACLLLLPYRKAFKTPFVSFYTLRLLCSPIFTYLETKKRKMCILFNLLTV